MTSVDIPRLLELGSHKLCPGCERRVVRAEAPKCSQCAAGITLPIPAAPDRRRTMSKSGIRRPASTVRDLGDGSRVGAGRVADGHRGGIDSQPGTTFWLVAHGTPVTQGSMKVVAAGVLRRDNGPELEAWRDEITKQALLRAGDGWTPINGPVTVAACLTLPWPSRSPFAGFRDVVEPLDANEPCRLPPVGVPDGDKLLRAVQDALSPRKSTRFKLLADDSRIVDSTVVKSFASPEQTHRWALPTPGLVLRVTLLGDCVDPMPPSRLSDPGELPPVAQQLHEQLSRRGY